MITESILVEAQEYAESALDWLVEDGAAESITVTTQRQGVESIAFVVLVKRPGETLPGKYFVVWDVARGDITSVGIDIPKAPEIMPLSSSSTGGIFRAGSEASILDFEDGLQSAIFISLFVDARRRLEAGPGENPDDRRGWWGDVYQEVSGDSLGSQLWRLSRRALTEPELLDEARTYAEDALAWLIQDRVVESVSVNVSRAGENTLYFIITIKKPGEQLPQKYAVAWDIIQRSITEGVL